MGDYIGDHYPYAKFHHNKITPFCPQICKNVHQVTRLDYFWFFLQPIAKTPALIFIHKKPDNILI